MSSELNQQSRVLFNWQPSSLSRSSLKDEFCARSEAAGLDVCDIEVRDPGYYGSYESRDWHPDGPIKKMLLWSNVRPTEVRFADGRLLAAIDGDVILIDNTEVEHRGPLDHAGRWLIRAAVRNL